MTKQELTLPQKIDALKAGDCDGLLPPPSSEPGMKMDVDGYLSNTESEYVALREKVKEALDNGDNGESEEILDGIDQAQRELRFLVACIKKNVARWEKKEAAALLNAATVAVQAEVIEMLVGVLEKAELLTVSGADIFNGEGSRLLRISNAQREEALRIAEKLGGK